MPGQEGLDVSVDAGRVVDLFHHRSRRGGVQRRSRVAQLLCAGALLAATIGIAGYAGGLRFNLTPSYPLGLWHIVPLTRDVVVGDLVFVCPPRTPAFEMALERGYLRHGLCPGWMSPLIKTVAAVAGQRVDIGASIAVDGVPLAHSRIHPVDGAGRALVPAASGVVPAGQLFLTSEFAGSYDSRYFGPVPAAGILGLARPIAVIDR